VFNFLRNNLEKLGPVETGHYSEVKYPTNADLSSWIDSRSWPSHKFTSHMMLIQDMSYLTCSIFCHLKTAGNSL